MNRPAERRQYKRFWVMQPAILKNNWAGSLQCEINDFCSKGILLSLAASSTSLSLAELQNQAVILEFRPDLVDADLYQLAGRVVRVTQNTLGIAVENFPINAFLDLTRVADENPAASTPAPAHAFTQHSLEAAKAKSHEQFIDFIQQVFQEFYETVDNKLIQAANQASDFAENRLFQTLYPVLFSRRAEIERVFLGASYFQQTFDQCPPSVDQHPSEQLSLVDIDDFEDWLNVSQVINELGFEHQSAIENFEIRYKALGSDAATTHNNPYGPYFIFQNFRKAIADIKLSNKIRAVLYKSFFDSLSRFFGDFYQGLNETVAFVPPVRTLKPAAAPGSAISSQAKDSAPANQGRQALASKRDSEPPRPSPGTTLDSPGHDQREYKLDHLLQYLSNPKTEFKAPIDHLVFPAQTGLTETPGVRPSGLMPTMNNLFNAAQNIQGYSVESGHPGTQPSPDINIVQSRANLEKIINVLDSVRVRQGAAAEQNDHASIRRRLATELPQLEDSETGGDKHFHAIRLFDELVSKPLTDDAQSSDIRALLKKLEMPLLKLALTDEKFLESDAHPARQTVNLFERCYVAADDFGKIFDPKLLKLLHQLADRIVDNCETSAAVFDEVNGILSNLLKSVEAIHRKNVSRIQLISEGGEKIYLVRDQVEQDIRLRLGGKMVPKIILVLIDSGWRHYLQLTSLRQSRDSVDYQQALALLDDLLELLAPDTIFKGSDAKKIHLLVAHVAEKLKETLFDEAAIEELTQNLSKQLQGKTPVEFQFHGMGKPDPAGKHPDNAEIHQLRTGDWLSFDQQGIRVPHQLIWSNISQSRFVFANRSATKKRHLEQHELVHAIKNGTAIKIPGLDAPFMERSAHKVMLDAYERLYHQATHDPETGLLNRKGLISQLEKIFAGGIAENQGDILCLMMFDQLKAIYHSCDQTEAEASLLAMVASLSEEIQPNDLFSRLGEDAFAVLFRRSSLDKSYIAAQNMVSRIKEHRITCQDKSFVLGVSAGIAELSADADSASTLLKNAGSACVAAKSMGSNTIQRYENTSLQIQSEQALFEWAGIIDKALNEDLLFLRCQKIQPVVSGDGSLPHYEILLGLDDSLGIQPFDFIRAAERWKRSPDLDQWVLRNSFKWIKENAAQLGAINGFSINLSGLSLVNENVLDFIRDALDADDLPAEKIIFEITENAAIERLDAAQDFIGKVKAYGCRFSLDDFGSGYSSFAYLKGLAVDYLKIDGAFIRDMLTDRADFAMVKSMHEVGHSLGLKTIAEYVENDAIFDQLKQIGIDYAQGYAIEKPMPLHQLLSA